jgi:hypothetical protein
MTTTESVLAVEPLGGAGLFDVDPDQRQVSQAPGSAVDGDVPAVPEEAGL